MATLGLTHQGLVLILVEEKVIIKEIEGGELLFHSHLPAGNQTGFECLERGDLLEHLGIEAERLLELGDMGGEVLLGGTLGAPLEVMVDDTTYVVAFREVVELILQLPPFQP